MRNPSRPILASLILAMCVASGAANAQTTFASGLGQAWPGTTDVSASPDYHVYVFDRNGVRYIQVNDANGNVRGAFARTPYAIIGLPMGSDAARLATAEQPLPAPASTTGVVVYDDGTVKVFVAPQANGTTQMSAVASDCKNPVECSSHGP